MAEQKQADKTPQGPQAVMTVFEDGRVEVRPGMKLGQALALLNQARELLLNVEIGPPQ